MNLVLSCLFTTLFVPSDRIGTTDQLLAAMRDRHNHRWYRTLTFVQKTTQIRFDGSTNVSTWYEAFNFPGSMRIDIDSFGVDGSLTQEVQFNRYERLGGGWIAPEVIVRVNDRVVMSEEYSEMRAGDELDARLFDPRHWRTARWR